MAEDSYRGDDANHRRSSSTIQLKIPKRLVWVLVGLVIAGIGVLSVLRPRMYLTIWSYIVPTSVQFTVVDKDTGRPVEEGVVRIDTSARGLNQELVTDSDGKTDVYRIWLAAIPVEVRSPGYVSVKETIHTHRGLNAITIGLQKDVRTVTFNGKIVDYVSEQPLTDVVIHTKSGDATTSSDGVFLFENVPVGSVDITLKKVGYHETTTSINLTDESVQTIPLTPNGTTVFTSNRDGGKRGLFVSDYDGKTVKPLVTRVGDTEDYSAITNASSSHVAFLSTRDKRTGSGGSYDSKLYLVKTDGTGLQKLTDNSSISQLTWSASGKYLFWVDADSQASDAKYHVRMYEVAKKQSSQVDQGDGSSQFVLSHTGAIIAWVENNYSTGTGGLFIRSVPGGEVKQIFDRAGAYNVAFSQQDAALHYSYYDNGTDKTVTKQYTLATGQTSDFTPDPDEDFRTLVPSPDGTRIAFIDTRDGQTDLFTTDASGNNEKRLTHLGTLAGTPVWDETGKYLLVDSSKTGETARYIVGVTGGSPKKVADISLEEYYY